MQFYNKFSGEMYEKVFVCLRWDPGGFVWNPLFWTAFYMNNSFERLWYFVLMVLLEFVLWNLRVDLDWRREGRCFLDSYDFVNESKSKLPKSRKCCLSRPHSLNPLSFPIDENMFSWALVCWSCSLYSFFYF